MPTKRKFKMLPKPRLDDDDEGTFSARTLSRADSRYAIVRHMRQRVEQLIDECGNTLAKELLANRAIHIATWLESQEMDLLEGKEMRLSTYLQAVRALSDVLSKLGLDKQVAGTQTLESYLLNAKPKKNGKAVKS